MSIRTIIEVNHDCLADLERHPEALQRLWRMLGAGEGHRIESGDIPGIRVLGQRHHSETLELKVR